MSKDQRNPSTGYIDGIKNTTYLDNYTGKRIVMVVVHISIIVVYAWEFVQKHKTQDMLLDLLMQTTIFWRAHKILCKIEWRQYCGGLLESLNVIALLFDLWFARMISIETL